MKRLTKKAWFGPKKLIGWGWAPASWEGSAVVIVYLILIFIAIHFLQNAILRKELVLGLTLILILVIILTGDRPGGATWQKK